MTLSTRSKSDGRDGQAEGLRGLQVVDEIEDPISGLIQLLDTVVVAIRSIVPLCVIVIANRLLLVVRAESHSPRRAWLGGSRACHAAR